MGWNYVSIYRRQRCNLWSLGMDKLFHPTLYNACNNLSMLVLKLIHVNKRSHWWLIDARVRQLTGSILALTLVHCKVTASIVRPYYRHQAIFFLLQSSKTLIPISNGCFRAIRQLLTLMFRMAIRNQLFKYCSVSTMWGEKFLKFCKSFNFIAWGDSQI